MDSPIDVVWVEEEEELARTASAYLENHGVVVRVVPDISQGVAAVLQAAPDAVVLDAAGGMSSVDACRVLRRRTDAPIILASEGDAESERVLGFDAGADDCITKPFSLRELLARIRAQARRARGEVGPRALRVGSLVVDRVAMTATLDGAPLALTTYELLLLHTLAERAGSAVSREQVVGRVRGDVAEAFERSVDIHICHLRAKLGDDPRRPRYIRTVRGVGYMLAMG